MSWLGVLGAGLAAGGSVLGGLINNAGQVRAQRDANDANKYIAEENRKWSAQQAREQMVFQERMSNSAHQRQVADLRAAGLNPILSASYGGASQPMGAMGSVPGTPSIQSTGVGGLGNAIAGAGGSALQILRAGQEMDKVSAEIQATKAQGLAAVAHAEQSQASAAATKANMPRVKAEAESAAAKSRVDVKRYKFDEGAVKYDGVSKRILEALGGATDAFSLRRLLMGKGASTSPRKLP